MANGGDWGGTKVDDAFVHFLEDALSTETYQKFYNESQWDVIDLLRDFEVKKRGVSANGYDKITMKIPSALNDSCHAVLAKDLKSQIGVPSIYT